MSYAIVINLDYDNQPADVCVELWTVIKESMLAAGFRRDGRRFSINLPEEEACQLARDVIAGIETHLDYHHKHIYRYLKDFYGYDMALTTNLLLPDLGEIIVDDES